MKIVNHPKKLLVSKKAEVIALNWALVEQGINIIARKLSSSQTFDYLFVIVRGGMVPAAILSHKLNVRNFAFYQGIKTRSNQPHDYGKFHPILLPRIVKGKRYLVIEDIIFEGDTVNSAVEYIKKRGSKCVGVCSLVIDEKFRKLPQFKANSVPLICAYECENYKWIRFAWENKLNHEHSPKIK